ncbi:MAG TPA: hypothetical protein PLF40_01150 [Kofleriaceae bacterium]|nr:hypothetical protein [Kofleriaceae bacterium]
MKVRSLLVALSLVASCSKGGAQQSGAGGKGSAAPSTVAGSAAAGSGSAAQAPKPVTPKPQVRDERANQLLSRGAECELSQGTLPLDCPEYKAVGDYGFQKQGSVEVAETCAAFLRDEDIKKRLLAARCLESLNGAGVTTQFAAGLDALEAEADDKVREQIAWSIKGAEAMATSVHERALEIVKKFAADPKRAVAGGYLFWSFFPQYMMGKGPTASLAAQALAIASLDQDDTPLQRTALDSVTLLEDKPAVCAGLVRAMRPDAKRWADAAEALASLKEQCSKDIPNALNFAIERLLAGDIKLLTFERFDRRYPIDPATRQKILAALKKARSSGFVRKVSDWELKDIDKTIAQFSKPSEAK